MRRDVWAGGCCDEAASYQLPIAVAFWIIRIVSVEECSSLAQNLMQIRCSAHSVILNVMATQDTCSLNGIYCPHWLVQWSRHCSHIHIPVHSPWLPGYTDVTHTVLVTLTMAEIFLDRPVHEIEQITKSRKYPYLDALRGKQLLEMLRKNNIFKTNLNSKCIQECALSRSAKKEVERSTTQLFCPWKIDQ